MGLCLALTPPPFWWSLDLNAEFCNIHILKEPPPFLMAYILPLELSLGLAHHPMERNQS